MTLVGSNLATSVTAAAIGTPSASRKLLVIVNPAASGASVYIGGANVASTNAVFTLLQGDPPMIIANALGDSLAGETWYARAASGTPTINFLEG